MGQQSNILTAGGTSIEQVVQLALAAHTSPESDAPAVVLPEGASLQGLEHLSVEPYRMRATYDTERITDFCAYVKSEGGDRTVVFVDPRGGGAQAILDYGTSDHPDWAEHQAELSMRHTPEFKALLDAARKKHDQRSLVEFLEDWRPFIQPYAMNEDDPDNASDLAMGTALARIRKIDVKKLLDTGHEDRDWSARKSTLASVEAVSGGDKPPAGFRFVCKPYPECQVRTVDVRLSIRTTSDEPVLMMRIVGETALTYEIAEEIELDITSRLDGQRVFVGSAQTHQR